MAQSRPKQPLDVLQSMINGILIEVGRALRASNKDGGRSLVNANTRLKSFFPGAIENFHQALDDLECDVVRAKAVFLRDLEELRAQRLALENPPIEATVEDTAVEMTDIPEIPEEESIIAEMKEPTPPSMIKEENAQVADPEPMKDIPPTEMIDESKETKEGVPEEMKGLQGPSPSSSNENKSNTVGLGIDTTATADDPVPASAGLLDSSIDSLFDMPGDENNGDSDINFDGLEFLDSNNTQGQNDFDLSTFGNSQDFSMPDLHTANDGTNTNDISDNKQEDIFGLGDISGGGDLGDLDLDLGAAGGDDSVFDDLFFGDGNTGGDMEHGEFDNAYFGLE